MIIHAYFTDGFYDWALFYLKTLRYHNKLLYPVVFNTVGLSQGQVASLQTAYPNITVLNEKLEIAKFSQRAGVSKTRIAKYKRQCENEYVTPTNRVWKLMTAGEDRVRALRNVMEQYHMQDFSLLHTDIDVYFRGQLAPLLRAISYSDIALRFRPKINPVKARMSIGVMGFRINLKTLRFMDAWINEISKVPPQMRPVGYGQISCWNAYKAIRHDKMVWANLPKEYGTHGQTKNSHKLWSGNIHKVGKVEVLRRFKEDFENIKRQGG